ncbi:MAG: type II toxin-antitoxin system RelE/ParE family toxin [Deltaproteobacteria bacterium]|nr:type II toxin-antitoxin system RelE/ParE family toxin [Deltaproteobacteria bacterium]
MALGSDFEREIERGIRLISQNPLRWPRFDRDRRRLVVRKFPYSIVYEMIGAEVVILAIAHGRRRPFYWRERVS